MHQHTCLSAARPGSHNDTTGVLVGDYLHLAFRQLTEQLFVFRRRQVALYFAYALSLEIFCDELLIIHLEIILHILQRCAVTANHQIGVFTDDMHLLDFLFVKIIEHAVVVFLVS